VHFVGTGKRANHASGDWVLPYITRYRLEELVSEVPGRVPYFDVMRHLQLAGGNLILGSTDPHYTPSKVFQVMHARRPVLALLHDQSTATDFLRSSGAGTVVSFAEGMLPSVASVASAVQQFVLEAPAWRSRTDWSQFEAFTARHSTRLLAQALDAALERTGSFQRRRGIIRELA
jgi:hypothetical protein